MVINHNSNGDDCTDYNGDYDKEYGDKIFIFIINI